MTCTHPKSTYISPAMKMSLIKDRNCITVMQLDRNLFLPQCWRQCFQSQSISLCWISYLQHKTFDLHHLSELCKEENIADYSLQSRVIKIVKMWSWPAPQRATQCTEIFLRYFPNLHKKIYISRVINNVSRNLKGFSYITSINELGSQLNAVIVEILQYCRKATVLAYWTYLSKIWKGTVKIQREDRYFIHIFLCCLQNCVAEQLTYSMNTWQSL